MYASVVIFLPSLRYSAVLFLFGWGGCGWFCFVFFFWCVCVGFCFSKREFLLSGALLQAKCRLALDMSDMYSESMSEPAPGKVYNLKPAVGGALLAGKYTIPKRPFPISGKRINKEEHIC